MRFSRGPLRGLGRVCLGFMLVLAASPDWPASTVGKPAELAYGEIYAAGNAVATPTTTQNVWVQFAQFTALGEFSGATPRLADDDILISGAGDYLIWVSISSSNAGANNAYEYGVQLNNGTILVPGLMAVRRLNPGGDVGVVELSGVETLAAGDTVELWVRNVTFTNAITLEEVNLTIERIAR